MTARCLLKTFTPNSGRMSVCVCVWWPFARTSPSPLTGEASKRGAGWAAAARARALAPTVIFLDECDAILTARSASEHESRVGRVERLPRIPVYSAVHDAYPLACECTCIFSGWPTTSLARGHPRPSGNVDVYRHEIYVLVVLRQNHDHLRPPKPSSVGQKTHMISPK